MYLNKLLSRTQHVLSWKCLYFKNISVVNGSKIAFENFYGVFSTLHLHRCITGENFDILKYILQVSN